MISPVIGGLIVDADSCCQMLREFCKRLVPKTAIFNPKLKTILNVPIGLTNSERSIFENVCLKAGLSEIVLVESILSSAIGMDLPVHTAGGCLVVNCGGGKTDVGVISMGAIVEGCSINIGGNTLDEAIIDYISGKYNIRIGHPTARRIKHDIASLYLNDNSETSILGADIVEKTPIEAVIKSSDVLQSIQPYFEKIIEAIKSVLSNCAPEVVADVKHKGLYLCGGTSMIPGFDNLLKDTLGLNIFLTENPAYTSIIGAGKLLNHRELLMDILAQM
jgi:rod shape-determining protein MreB